MALAPTLEVREFWLFAPKTVPHHSRAVSGGPMMTPRPQVPNWSSNGAVNATDYEREIAGCRRIPVRDHPLISVVVRDRFSQNTSLMTACKIRGSRTPLTDPKPPMFTSLPDESRGRFVGAGFVTLEKFRRLL